MQQMQYHAPNRLYVFQNFSGVTPPDPLLVLGPRLEPPPPLSKILAAPLAVVNLVLNSKKTKTNIKRCSLKTELFCRDRFHTAANVE